MAQRRIRLPPLPPVFQPDESHTLVDDFTMRAERHRARQAPATPPVFPLPLRTHPLWSGNNSLGIEVDLDQDTSSTAVFERTVLKMDEWGMPTVWSIALSTNFQPSAANDSQAYALEALIEWGCGGTIDNVAIDWVNGTVIRLPMNAVNVKIRGLVGTPAGGTGATVPTDLRARVTLAPGFLPGPPPQRNAFATSVQADATPWVGATRVPRYAKSFVPFARTRAGADQLFAVGNYWEFYAQDPGGGGPPGILGTVRAPDALQWLADGIPIPHNARLVAFINTTGPVTLPLNLAFNLCL